MFGFYKKCSCFKNTQASGSVSVSCKDKQTKFEKELPETRSNEVKKRMVPPMVPRDNDSPVLMYK
jgi:hypothetical protein